MITGIDPKVDYAFKWLFGKDTHHDLLLSLLNAVLKPAPGQTIVSVEILNPFNDKDALDDKLSILDIKARDQFGRLYNIEMQMRGTPILLNRLLYYWAVLHSGQLREGQDYNELRPTITICFVNSVLFRDVGDHHLHFELRSEKHPELLYGDQQAIHLVELPKFAKKAEELTDPFDLWCYFLIHGESLEADKLPQALQQGPVHHAVEELTMFTQDTTERERYEARLKSQRDHSSFLREAREEGRKEGRQEGKQEGIEEGLAKGQLIGQILFIQSLLERAATSREKLTALPLSELETIAHDLELHLKKQ